VYKVTCGPTVMVDCDDTLVTWAIPKGWNGDTIDVECRNFHNVCVPNKHNINLLIKLASRGHSVIVWSGGGADWAESVVKALELEPFVEVVMGKPTYYIDDKHDPREWIGKHGFFTLDGKRIHGQNLTDIQED